MSASGPYATRLWRRARRSDHPCAVVAGAVNLLLGCVLLSMMIGGPFFEATIRAQETAAQELAFRVFGCWLVGGLVLFLALGMTRTAVVHLLTLFLPPAVLILVLLAL
ncbi:hypothetical protein [Streptomyces sp. NBC_00347]|uniref:hypothetical protein n=1 Tax=Streptomyces sp. NBC_00347 TaxID=2975721 RepID=UPI002258BAE4|nr:hypothetical protein [Streptomyces sp. NBC_00347]MCX5129621.1 hypothetical protein [Streptomyces sp. NBC_00347]